MQHLFLFVFLFILGVGATAQNVTIKCINVATNQPAVGVTIANANKPIGVTDSNGLAKVNLQNGNYNLKVSGIGFETTALQVTVPTSNIIIVQLQIVTKQEAAVTVVSSTRNNQKIENSPLKVEVLGSVEMDEENTIKPAGIASILGDVSGVQIQQSSAVTSNSNVRIQGLDGRYTQILKDGMPLYDGFSGGFGILSIPPLDLKQVELIKGSASTLYGGGAIGGLVNIISRKPTTKQEAVFTANYSTLTETNLNTFISKKNKKFGYTFFGGYTTQQAQDVNNDLFSDVPKQNTLVLHPRLFIYPKPNTTITVGHTLTNQTLTGGDIVVINDKANSQHQYFETNKTYRNSTELVVEQNLGGRKKLELKTSYSTFNRSIQTNTTYFKGNQTNYFAEASYYKPYQQNSFVAGINLVGDEFIQTDGTALQLNNFGNNVVGAFVQNTWRVKNKATIEVGLRNDVAKTYGNFLLPRAAIIVHLNKSWATRVGVGAGYKLPNALASQNRDFEIQTINNLPSTIKAEKSIGYNAEVNYKKEWGEGNEFFVNHAFFLTTINQPVIANQQFPGQVTFSNATKPIVSKGFDTYIRTTLHEWELYIGYTYTIAERKYLTINQFVPLTPKNRMAFTIVHDWEEQGWRIGLEGSYNGYQYRDDASKTPAYFFAAAMVEKKLGKHFSIVLNGENLLNFKQSNSETLYTGTVLNPNFKALWAPIDGRVINVSVKCKL